MPKDLIQLARDRKLVNHPAPEKPTKAAASAPEPDTEADEVEDLSKLYKAELVERAEAAGHDTEGLSKAELVELLETGDN